MLNRTPSRSSRSISAWKSATSVYARDGHRKAHAADGVVLGAAFGNIFDGGPDAAVTALPRVAAILGELTAGRETTRGPEHKSLLPRPGNRYEDCTFDYRQATPNVRIDSRVEPT